MLSFGDGFASAPAATLDGLGAGARPPPQGSAGSRISEPLGELERGLEAVGEARLDAFADHDAVDHHLDVVLVLLVERGGVLDLVELAVDADPR